MTAHTPATLAPHLPQPVPHVSLDSTLSVPHVSLPVPQVPSPKTECVNALPVPFSATNVCPSAPLATATSVDNVPNALITVPLVTLTKTPVLNASTAMPLIRLQVSARKLLPANSDSTSLSHLTLAPEFVPPTPTSMKMFVSLPVSQVTMTMESEDVWPLLLRPVALSLTS